MKFNGGNPAEVSAKQGAGAHACTAASPSVAIARQPDPVFMLWWLYKILIIDDFWLHLT
jgi:hypothetical protein